MGSLLLSLVIVVIIVVIIIDLVIGPLANRSEFESIYFLEVNLFLNVVL